MNHFPVQTADVSNPYLPHQQWPGQYTGGQQFVPQPFMAPSYPLNGASMTVPMTIVQKEVGLIPFDGAPGHYQQFKRLFDAVYGTNPAFTDSQKFLLFHKYIGSAGRPFLDNIDPIDPMSLVNAKGQMRLHFNDPFRVRAQVKAIIDALPVIKSACQTAVLEKSQKCLN